MTDPLDDRLAALGAGPVPPLAPADAVRARGAQRRARTRALLGSLAAAFLLLVGGGAFALLVPDPTPPDRLDVAVPTPATPTGAALDPALLLQPDDGARVAGGEWEAGPLSRDPAPALQVCPEPGPAATGGVARELRREGATVLTQVLRHDRPAGDVLADLRADVARCPSRPDPAQGDRATVSHDLDGAPLEDSVQVRALSRPDRDSEAEIVTWVVVAGQDGLVGYVRLPADERGSHLPGWAQSVRDRLEGRTPQSPAPSTAPSTAPPASTGAPAGPDASPSPSPSASARPITDVVLTVADARRAEPGVWSDGGNADEGPVLDPCPGGTRYPRDADRTADASRVLMSEREVGGTFLAQQVARYPSEAVARDAAAGYVRAVRGCPTAPGGPPEGTTVTHEVLRSTTVGGAATTFVRRTTTCDTCVTGHTYFAVQQRDDLVSVLLAEIGEDGDPGEDLVVPFAREAARRLAP